jgi:fructose-bisphosphate aldolase class II
MTLNQYLAKASQQGWALGHFNFSNLEIAQAIANAAQKLKSPVMLGTSEGEAQFIGYYQARAIVDALKKTAKVPLFLNADHHRSFETARKALEAGYSSVQLDGSDLPFEENLSLTKQVADFARSLKREVSVEGELGYLPGSSKILTEKITLDPKDLTRPEQAALFVRKTQIDRLAIAVGNIHGIITDSRPIIDFERIRAIRKAVPQNVALVLHGGSGIQDADFQKAIQAGINNIHINTEIRVAFAQALRNALQADPSQTTPYHYLKAPREAAQKVVEQKIRLFAAPLP